MITLFTDSNTISIVDAAFAHIDVLSKTVSFFKSINHAPHDPLATFNLDKITGWTFPQAKIHINKKEC